MPGRPPLVLLVIRALIALTVEAALLAWGLGGKSALLASPRALANTISRVRPTRLSTAPMPWVSQLAISSPRV